MQVMVKISDNDNFKIHLPYRYKKTGYFRQASGA